jgi:two-component system, NtrC family, sensor kinase
MEKILIIDDEPAIVRTLSMSLAADGHEVVQALGGQEGLDVFRKEKPDIVITDVKMPGMDGLDVLKKIKALNRDAEVIIITGHGGIDAAIDALKYGASDFLNKPIRDKALSVAIRRAAEKLEIKKKLAAHTHDLENMIRVATEEIKRKSNFQSALIESSHDGIVATNIEDRIMTFNPAAEEIFGISRREIIRTQDSGKLYPPELQKSFAEERDLPWTETEITAGDGTKASVKASGKILRLSGSVIGAVAFFQDIREIKKLEMELLKSEKLAAVGQTVAGMAHCVKNILHGFSGGSYMMDIGLDKKDINKIHSAWKMVTRNIARMSDLVMDLLSYAKDRHPDYETCHPNQIIHDVRETMSYMAVENGIELITVPDPSIGEVCMDGKSIRRAIMNLVSNAVDACALDDTQCKKCRVEIQTVRKEGNRVDFIVKDNGAGMDDEVKKRLFTSFFSTKGSQGTGLGLLVTRKLVEEHHGDIRVDSTLGEGSSFTVTIPYKKPENACDKIR